MASHPTKEELLAWSKEQTRGYKGVDICDLSVSWMDGMALCALIHSLDTSQFKYEPPTIATATQSMNHDTASIAESSITLSFAFERAAKMGIQLQGGISSLKIGGGDTENTVMTWMLSIYHYWQQQQQQHRKEELLLAQQLRAQELKAMPSLSSPSPSPSSSSSPSPSNPDDVLSFLSEKHSHVGRALSDSMQIKGLLVNVEEELNTIHHSLQLSEKHNEIVKSRLTEKTAELENTIEKERLQYDQEIAQLESVLEELKKNGPSDQQLMLKRKLNEQMEKKDRLIKLKQQMEQEIEQLKAQLEQDEQTRIQLQSRRALAEQRRLDLRQKHKEELQKLQKDLSDSFSAQDKLNTDFVQQNYVKNSLQADATRLNADIKTLDGVHTSIARQNTELREKKQKLESQLLGAKLYLEEETRILNFKELKQSDLQQQKKVKAEERDTGYEVKRSKEKLHRKIASELVGAKEVYDKEHIHINTIKRDVSELEIKSEIIKQEYEEEQRKRNKKLQQAKELHKLKMDKEAQKHTAKVDSVVSQISSLTANSLDAQAILQAEKAKIEEIRAKSEDLSTETRSTTHSLEMELSSQKEAGRAQDSLKRELQLASEFLVGDQHTKKKNIRAKAKAEDHLKSIADSVAQNDSKKAVLEQTHDSLARDYELSRQDLKLAERELKRAKEEKQKLTNERNKLKQELTTENEKHNKSAKGNSLGSADLRSRLHEEEKQANESLSTVGQEIHNINDKIDSLKLEAARLEADKAALEFDQQQVRIAKESEKLVLEQDRLALKKLQDQRAELKDRLEKNLAEQEGKSDGEKKELQVEEEIIRKRKSEIEKLIKEEIMRQ